MKIAVTVVLYNPSNDQVENLKTYCNLFDKVYALDNSDNGFKLPQDILSNGRLEYKSFGENLGIAYGLKTACEMANSDGFDLLLTMDQDSKYPVEDHANIVNQLNKLDLSNIGLVCLNTSEYKDDYKDQPDIITIDMFITSGNFIVLKNYFKTEGFDKKLFIDMVDFDLCYKFIKNNYKILLLTKYYIIHAVGYTVKKKFLFRTVAYGEHSLVRYYYMYRNDWYLYHIDKKYFKWNHRTMIRLAIKVLIIGEDKRKKFKMIRRGIKDAKKGIFGKYKKKNEQ